MYKNLKQRDLSVAEWRNFNQKDGYMVADADKVFDILTDITWNKEQRTLDEFRKNKNSKSKIKSPSKIKPEYEEEIITTKSLNNIITPNKSFDENKNAKSKPLSEVNAQNIDIWISIMNKAVTDLSSTQAQNKIQLFYLALEIYFNDFINKKKELH